MVEKPYIRKTILGRHDSITGGFLKFIVDMILLSDEGPRSNKARIVFFALKKLAMTRMERECKWNKKIWRNSNSLTLLIKPIRRILYSLAPHGS